MHTTFKLAKGVFVTDLSGIYEGYSLEETDEGYSVFTVNVSAERLEHTFLSLAKLVRTPGFAIVEIPTYRDEEQRLGKEGSEAFHKDVYCLDELNFDQFKDLFAYGSKFFVDDGVITFGFASDDWYDEVFVDRYKITYIYAAEPEKYKQALEALGYERREPLTTVWNNITWQTPGRTDRIEIDGKTVYDLVQELQREKGFYFVERRES